MRSPSAGLPAIEAHRAALWDENEEGRFSCRVSGDGQGVTSTKKARRLLATRADGCRGAESLPASSKEAGKERGKDVVARVRQRK